MADSSENSTKKKFSWEAMVGKKLLTKASGDKNSKSTLTCMKNKELVALYFSASWCPPCQKFSPVLKDFYNTLGGQSASNKLEVVYISSDRRVEDFTAYYETMPWLAIPAEMGSAKVKENLANTLGIRSIPTLIILDAVTGEFVASSGREDVSAVRNAKDLEKCQQVLQLWNAQERQPLENARNAVSSGDGGPIMRILMFFAQRPIYVFGLLYIYKYMTKKMQQWYPEASPGGAIEEDPIPVMPDGESEF